jgi:hypothetical protein
MKSLYLFGVVVWVLLLSACDNAEEPVANTPPPTSKAAPSVAPVAPATLAPAAPPVEPKTASLKPSAQRLPAVNITASPAKRPTPKVLEMPELDLSIPEELLETVELGEALPQTPLLPSLFGHQQESDFRLNGRLISSDDEDKMFEGAELSFEFKN